MKERMELRRKYQGIQTHRLRSNPLETWFAVSWQRRCKNHDVLKTILDEVSERDRLVANTIVQWFGSPVGESFLRDAIEVNTTFAKAWKQQCACLPASADTLDYLLHRGDQHYPVRCSKRDREVADAVIGWLDTKSGRRFIDAVLSEQDWPDPLEVVLSPS